MNPKMKNSMLKPTLKKTRNQLLSINSTDTPKKHHNYLETLMISLSLLVLNNRQHHLAVGSHWTHLVMNHTPADTVLTVPIH